MQTRCCTSVESRSSACRRSRRNAMDLIYSATRSAPCPRAAATFRSASSTRSTTAPSSSAEPPAGVASALFDYQLQARHAEPRASRSHQRRHPGGRAGHRQDGHVRRARRDNLLSLLPPPPPPPPTPTDATVRLCGATLICCTTVIERQWRRLAQRARPDRREPPAIPRMAPPTRWRWWWRGSPPTWCWSRTTCCSRS